MKYYVGVSVLHRVMRSLHVYTYEVEAENADAAKLTAHDDFMIDVGYDMSKDFKCIGSDILDEKFYSTHQLAKIVRNCA